jgi:hypothetical protein
MVALAIAALCVGLTLALAIRLTTSQADAAYRTRLQEFTLTILEDYRVLGPSLGDRGEMPGGWVWSLTATPEGDPGGSRKSLGLAYLDVTVTAFNRDRPKVTFEETEVVARRYQDVFR